MNNVKSGKCYQGGCDELLSTVLVVAWENFNYKKRAKIKNHGKLFEMKLNIKSLKQHEFSMSY